MISRWESFNYEGNEQYVKIFANGLPDGFPWMTSNKDGLLGALVFICDVTERCRHNDFVQRSQISGKTHNHVALIAENVQTIEHALRIDRLRHVRITRNGKIARHSDAHTTASRYLSAAKSESFHATTISSVHVESRLLESEKCTGYNFVIILGKQLTQLDGALILFLRGSAHDYAPLSATWRHRTR